VLFCEETRNAAADSWCSGRRLVDGYEDDIEASTGRHARYEAVAEAEATTKTMMANERADNEFIIML